MLDEMKPALQRLEAKLQKLLEDAKRTKQAINALHEAYDSPPPYTDTDESQGMRSIARGQFYGQPLATCIRTILEMRKSASIGAGSVNEIYAALKEGGYAFEAKDDENAKAGLRQSLRKNPIFHRIPSGDWGMLAWYPNAKVERSDESTDELKDKKAKPNPVGKLGEQPTENDADDEQADD